MFGSFLIGKRLAIIQDHISNGDIQIVITEQLLIEIREVTQRPKLRKYFPPERVAELIQLLEAIAIKIDIIPEHHESNDPKDNFLLDLMDNSMADFLVTGDKGLLKLNPFKTTTIVTPTNFEILLK